MGWWTAPIRRCSNSSPSGRGRQGSLRQGSPRQGRRRAGSNCRRRTKRRSNALPPRCSTFQSTRWPGSRRRTQTMGTSSLVVDKAQELSAAGRHSDVVQYLGARERSELEASPALALLYGTAQARLGRPEEGVRWLDVALDQARKRDERLIERRALNARGATAFVSGRIDEAADYFTQAMMVASREGDFATTGRCSNNVGVISNLRGRHAEAIGSWEIALAAFGRAGVRQGVAECHHNLGIAYREQGALDHALTEADRAVAEAESVGDLTLRAQ